MRGVYCLITKLGRDKTIKIGKRKIPFKKGFYCYVGSALNSLEKRIGRHYSSDKKPRWHIDYFLMDSGVSLIGHEIMETGSRKECELSEKVKEISSSSVKGFGCSDCSCKSHLYFFDVNPKDLIQRISLHFL